MRSKESARTSWRERSARRGTQPVTDQQKPIAWEVDFVNLVQAGWMEWITLDSIVNLIVSHIGDRRIVELDRNRNFPTIHVLDNLSGFVGCFLSVMRLQ